MNAGELLAAVMSGLDAEQPVIVEWYDGDVTRFMDVAAAERKAGAFCILPAPATERTVRLPSRTVLAHVNVELPADDPRTADQVRDALLGALEVGSDHETMHGLTVAIPLAEEV